MLRVLVLNDLSGLGRCSLAADIAILSAFSHEVVALPTAVLSTQTSGFSGYRAQTLTEQAIASLNHYAALSERFDAVLVGYMPDPALVSALFDRLDNLLKQDGILFTDPVMADNDTFYDGFNSTHRDALYQLCAVSDIIFPNHTEALFLADKTNWLDAKNVLSSLASGVVITGIREGASIRTYAAQNGLETVLPSRPFCKTVFHGAGDVFAAAFTGCFLATKDFQKSAALAVEYIDNCLDATLSSGTDTRYGTAFPEKMSCLHALIRRFC